MSKEDRTEDGGPMKLMSSMMATPKAGDGGDVGGGGAKERDEGEVERAVM